MNADMKLAKIEAMITGLNDIVKMGRLGKADTEKLNIAIDHAIRGRQYFIAGDMDRSGMNIAIARDFMVEVVRNNRTVA